MDADKAWAKTNETAERARGLRRFAELEERHGDLEQSENLFRQACLLYAAEKQIDSVVDVQCQLSGVMLKRGDSLGAIEEARNAVATASERAEQSLPTALYTLGQSFDDDADTWQEAEETLLRAYDEAITRGQLVIAAQAAGDLAKLLVVQERLDDMLVWNERSEGLYAEVGNERGLMVCARNAARAYELQGRTDEQVTALRRALEAARSAGAVAFIPELSSLLAQTLGTPESLFESLAISFDHAQRELLKEASSGEEYEERSRSFIDEILDSLPKFFELDQALYLVITLVRSTTVTQLGLSVALAGRALDRWKDHKGPLIAWLRFELGKLVARLGDHYGARDLLQESYEEAKEAEDTNLQVAVAANLALSCQALVLVDEARTVLEEALPVAKEGNEADSLRLNLAVNHMIVWEFLEAEPILTSVLTSGLDRKDQPIIAMAAANLAALKADTKRASEALDYLALIDENISNVAIHQKPEVMRLKGYVLELAGRNDDALAAYGEMVRLTDEQQRQLTSPGLQGIFLASRWHLYPRAIGLAIQQDPAKGLYFAEVGRARALAQSMRGPRGTHTVPEDIAERVRRKLTPTEAAVTYYIDKDRLLIWFISSAEVRVVAVSVDAGELHRVTAVYRESLDNDSEDHSSQVLLTEWLIEPVSVWLEGYKTIYFSPHGPLHNIPFQALGNDERLVQTHDVAVIPAVHLLDQKPAWGESWKVRPLILGDPGSNLSSAREEAEEVAQALPGSRLLLGLEATKGAFLSGLGTASMLHLATHARFDPAAPFQSGVVLASVDGGTEFLTLPEIVRLQGVPKLVVLSACETRLAAVSDSDDPVGIAAAFLIAGAETVVSSLWQVSDQVTAELMRSFYSALETQPPISALAVAQRRLDKGLGHDASSWGAFAAYSIASSRRVRKRGTLPIAGSSAPS